MSAKNQNNNIAISFDWEYWHCGTVLKKYLPKDKSQLPKIYPNITEKILATLKKKQSRATFFILCDLAQENPELVKKISIEGHEIALHGLDHELIFNTGPEDFDRKIKQAKKIISDIVGYEPKGFRAPNFSIFNKARWALKILKDNGFDYDSSLFPFLIKFWGKVKKDNDVIQEYPIAVYKLFGFNIPIGGGFYFRIIPYPFLKFFLKRIIKKEQTPVMYFHPFDLAEFKYDINMPRLLKKIKFMGTSNAYKKFEKLLKDFNAISINQI